MVAKHPTGHRDQESFAKKRVSRAQDRRPSATLKTSQSKRPRRGG